MRYRQANLIRIWRCWMREPILPLTDAELDEGPVCAYVVDDPGGSRICGSPRRQSSSYCPFHHSLCYIVSGSKAGSNSLREGGAAARAVGGLRAQGGEGPSRRFLERLERAVRTSA